LVYYTGDIHGQATKIQNFISRFQLTQDDTIVILGDVGLNYYDDSRDKHLKRQLNAQGVTILSIHGNHEKRPQTLPYYAGAVWRGGIVYKEDAYPNLLFAKDGELYNLDGMQTIVIGGAYSVDKFYRLRHGLRWFADEQPSQDTKDHVESMLATSGWKVDTVLSHTCPAKYLPMEAFISCVDQSTVDHSTENWLDTIEDRLSYEHWLCGHWHIDKRINKMHFLMNGFEVLSKMIL